MGTPRLADSLAEGAVVAARASVRVTASVAAVTVLPGLAIGVLLAVVGLPAEVAGDPRVIEVYLGTQAAAARVAAARG